MSTVEDYLEYHGILSTVGGYYNARWRYHEYRGGV